jgi:hypothetical protein
MGLAKYGAWLAMIDAVCALILVGFGTVTAAAFNVLFRLVGVDLMKGLDEYPLGVRGVLAVYAVGAALGWLALRQPKGSGIAMIVLAMVGFAFGGPVAKLFGLVLVVAALLCLLGARFPKAQ